ncbi:hypothetical protein [Paenibacillus hamazuiensis]|uniref:hypothetical protein n=1 Tax=Paenibacillus hamazuiensis TaxID=2936508 RepID=UPI00200C8842|nr:hypothetical protein [Paenibacillus hamazuiensis]
MEKEEIQRLEEKFDRELSEGEAAEIANTPVLHQDDEAFYEDDNDAAIDAPTAVGLLYGDSGRQS